MTVNDLAALLRADPDRAAKAIELAKIAGPWRPVPLGRAEARAGWSTQCPRPEGLRVAADRVAQDAHDRALRADGWALAGDPK